MSSPWLYMPEQISISKSTAEFLLQRLTNDVETYKLGLASPNVSGALRIQAELCLAKIQLAIVELKVGLGLPV
jgi:hypothetical protein